MVNNHRRSLTDEVLDHILRYAAAQSGIMQSLSNTSSSNVNNLVVIAAEGFRCALAQSLVERLESCSEAQFDRIVDYLVEQYERACFTFEDVHGQ